MPLIAIIFAMTRLRAWYVALVGTSFLLACQSGEQAPATKSEAAREQPPLPVAEPPLNRGALLSAVARAASATALQEDDEAEQRLLDGKRFELRIRFGCEGATDLASPWARGWTFDEKTRVLRVRIEPDLVRDAAVDQLVGSEFEDVEGSWVPRPWLLAAGCPRASPPRITTPEPDPADAGADQKSARVKGSPRGSVGIAQVYTAMDSRARRRNNRAFEVTKVLDAEQRPSATGYDLVLSGRLRALPSGRVISCMSEDPDQAPRCLISAQFDRTAVEQPGGGETLAEWSAG